MNSLDLDNAYITDIKQDDDAIKFIKIFSLKSEDEINEFIKNHEKEPHLRILQNALADEITQIVHDKNALDVAKSTSNILFGKSTRDDFNALSEEMMESISTRSSYILF